MADSKTAATPAAGNQGGGAANSTSASANTQTTKPAELKQDGPTVVEYVKAGYSAKDYPPAGYASKSTAEEIAAVIKAEEDAAAAAANGANADAGDDDDGDVKDPLAGIARGPGAKIYILQRGKHVYKNAEGKKVVAKPGDPVVLTPEQYNAFKDKFQGGETE